MEFPKVERWKLLLLLSIIIPVSLLSALKLTGIILSSGSVPIENPVILQPRLWEFERSGPLGPGPVNENWTDENVTAGFQSEEFSMNSTVRPADFIPMHGSYGGDSCLDMGIEASAVVSSGFISTVNFTMQENYTASQIYVYDYQIVYPPKPLENLSVTNFVEASTGIVKARFDCNGVNKPSQVKLLKFAAYVLRSPYNQSHLFEVDFQFSYFNGSAFKSYIQPFLLHIYPDNNNSFETAEELSINQTRRAYIEWEGFLNSTDPVDTVDYYKVWLIKGTTVDMVWKGDSTEWLRVQVFDPSRSPVSQIFRTEDNPTALTLPVNETGYWYVKVDAPYLTYYRYALSFLVGA